MKYSFTTSQKNQIKSVLGYGYAKTIKQFLDKQKVFNANNKPYSLSNVRIIFNGQSNNKLVVSKILQLYHKKKKEQDRLQEQLKNL